MNNMCVLVGGMVICPLVFSACGQENATASPAGGSVAVEEEFTASGADFTIFLGPEEPAIDTRVWSQISTSPDSSIPMVKIDGKFVVFTWGGMPLDVGEKEIAPWFCTGQGRNRLCDGMARLSGDSLETLVFDPQFDDHRPLAVYRRPPVGPMAFA